MITNEEYIVSIIVPFYNPDKYFDRCINSLFSQTYKNIEYIFINDCSTDNSDYCLREKIRSLNLGKRVILIENKCNIGVAKSRTIGIKSASGKFVFFVDSDDYILNNTIEKLVNAQVCSNSDIVLCEMVEIRDGYEVPYTLPNFLSHESLCIAQLAHETRVSIWGELIKRSLFLDNNIFSLEGIQYAEDYQITPKLSFYAKKICVLHESLYQYEKRNPNSLTFVFTVEQINDSEKALGILYDFFKDKGDLYLAAWNRAVIHNDLFIIKNITNNDTLNDIYNLKKNKILSLSSEYIKGFPISEKLQFYFVKRKKLLYVMNILLMKIKHVLIKCKYHYMKDE